MGFRYPNLPPPPLPAFTPAPKITVTWVPLNEKTRNLKEVLYLYQVPGAPILYLGKAYSETVAQRWDSHVTEGMITYAPVFPPRPISAFVGIVEV